ncbi:MULTISPECIES: hypothetical protein [Burkholderia]|uniref:hypothetical protein n=1 Tax=Burkholderia TaxID=32008 RepID=UPI0011B94513|nr:MULTISPECIES: hypothetical protein [Burkholderia]MDP9548439.1 hypothetical protein [Burkholderia cepacia]MBR8469387.1 hypothetical protein [Burkholderia cenocepacia]MDO5921212.1 hypothetical protein [Burkholderia cenocepacia]MDP9598555.1 hypothetical protein [Burkholderia cepacia]MDP9626614.1 hypothetical protein [Burkholderia cepacia]
MASPTKPDAPTVKGADTADVRMVTATVARGRTVRLEDGTDVRAGEEVTLPEVEVIALRRHGFLVDPDAAVVRRDTGQPQGPSISRSGTAQRG